MALERRIRDIQKRRTEVEKTYGLRRKSFPVLCSLNLSPGCETEWERLAVSCRNEYVTCGVHRNISSGLPEERASRGSSTNSNNDKRASLRFPEDKAREFGAAFDEGIPLMRTAVRYAERELGSRELEIAEAALEEHERRLGALRKACGKLI